MCLNRTILWLWYSVNHVMSHMQPPSLSSWKQPTYLPFIHQFLFCHVHLYHLNSFIKWDHCWYSLSSNLFVRENKSKSREQINAFNDFVVHLFFANITEPVSLNNICLFISLDITELPAIFLKFWHRVVCSLFNTFFGFLISFPLRIELCLSNILQYLCCVEHDYCLPQACSWLLLPCLSTFVLMFISIAGIVSDCCGSGHLFEIYIS